MSPKKPRILVIGAGMAGLTAANKLHIASKGAFDIQVVEGGNRIGGRINTSMFCGDLIEMGATWIHGIDGSPVYEMAKELGLNESTLAWERMDGFHCGPRTVVENGFEVDSCLVKCISKYFDVLMDFAQGKQDCCENGKRVIETKKNEQNGMTYRGTVKTVFEIKENEQNGVKKCEMVKKDYENKEVKENGMNYSEMDKRAYEIDENEQNGMNYNVMAKRVYESKEIEQDGVKKCEIVKRAYENKEVEENRMNYCEKAKKVYESNKNEQNGMNYNEMAKRAYEICVQDEKFEKISIGVFLRKGLELYKDEVKRLGDWDQESILEAVFEMKENTQRTYTSADDLGSLDFEAEREYKMFPGEEITIAKGYTSIIESLASVLPDGYVKLGRKVTKIEWQGEDRASLKREFGGEMRAVKVNFSDGSYMYADHIILTVSLGVLKYGVCEKSCMFNPPLPRFKVDAISRLGYGVVNKLFLKLNPSGLENGCEDRKFPFLQMSFHKMDSEFRNPKVPLWMRRTNSLCPIYGNSSVVLSWFAGKEALELESLEDEEIIDGVSNTLSCFMTNSKLNVSFNIGKVLKTQWGNDPLFLGSYSYIALGSSCEDLDTMATPLPENIKHEDSFYFPFQILFAGEATHRTHYSTTHGAYFSGLREANRLLQHYGL